MIRFLRAAAPLALLLAACKPEPAAVAPASRAERPAEGRPALWRVSDKDTTIYLLGTIHVLPTGFRWETGRIPAAIVGSERLILETVVPKDPAAVSNILLGMGQSPGLPPLLARVGPDKREALRSAIDRSGLPANVLDGLETWAAGFLLVATQLGALGLDGGNGVEEQLSARFEEGAKPIAGLETVREQLGFFDTLPEADQRAFLEGVVDKPEALRDQYEAMLAAWAKADLPAIARTFDEELEQTPRLRERLVTARNRAWAAAIARSMAEPGTWFIAVGAGHLTGAGSVPELLGKASVKVERVQ
jgi:uncharacterized protein